MSRPRYILVLLWMVISQAARSQEHSYVHYDVHEGLAGATVYSMTQDRDGFIWFATETGISRYTVRILEKTEINMKMSELEQMALRSQMNPHFIFNCLNSIQQYVIYRDVLGANEFITKFSYLIRQTLDLSSRKGISIQQEINYIDTYMSLEKKRFDNKFIYEIVVGEEVDRMVCSIEDMEDAEGTALGTRINIYFPLEVALS